jgi:hypothetical protein
MSSVDRLETSDSFANHFKLVQETLTEAWKSYPRPLLMESEDLNAGIKLLTQIALKSITKEAQVKESEPPQSSHHKVSIEVDSMQQIDDKIKKFVTEKKFAFRVACETGFPFAHLKGHGTKATLKHALEHFYDSILAHFLTLKNDVWMNEKELDDRFGDAFFSLNNEAIGEACCTLLRAYLKNDDNRAGYYILWLIKKVSGISYEIPSRKSFKKSTLAEVLSKFLERESITIMYPINFVEIVNFQSRPNPVLCRQILDKNALSNFMNIVTQVLSDVPIDRWSDNARIITNLLESSTPESRVGIAKLLVSNPDQKTSEVGNHLLSALNATSYTEAIPHLNILSGQLSIFDEYRIPKIFHVPFMKLHSDRIRTHPSFVRRLGFNVIKKVFVYSSLIIGPYRAGNETNTPDSLLAFDMNTEKLVWGIPLNYTSLTDPSENTHESKKTSNGRVLDNRYHLEMMGDRISLQYW